MADLFLSFQRDVEELLNAVNDLIASFPSREPGFLYRAAETLELTGDYSRSFDYYLKASEKTNDVREEVAWLLEAAGLALLMGETAKGEMLVQQILSDCEPGRQKAQAFLLLSQIYFYQGRDSDCLKALQDSLSEKILPEALLWQTSLSRGGSENKKELSELFPDSVSDFLQRGDIAGKTEPLYLGLTAPEDSDAETALNPLTTEDKTLVNINAVPDPVEKGAIQTGSFVDAENARELQKDLEKIGYQTEIRITERNNRTYHQVLIVGIEKSVLRDELNKLRARGYDGFITQ